MYVHRWHNRNCKCMQNKGMTIIWVTVNQVCLLRRQLSIRGRKSTAVTIMTLMRKQARRTTATSLDTQRETNTRSPPGVQTPPTSSFSLTLHSSFCGDKWVPLAWQWDKEQTGPDLRHGPQFENTYNTLPQSQLIQGFANCFTGESSRLGLHNKFWYWREIFLLLVCFRLSPF